MPDYPVEPFLYSDNFRQQINLHRLSDLLSYRPDQLFVPHKTSFYVIHLFEEGSGPHTVDFNTFEAKANHILFLSPGQVNQFHRADYTARILIFTEEFFVRGEAESQLFAHTPLLNDPFKLAYFDLGDKFGEVCALFDFVANEIRKGYGTEQPLILNSYLYNILLIAGRAYNDDTETLPVSQQKLLVSRFKALAEQRLTLGYPVSGYAQELNVSVRTLQKSFAAVEGMPPGQWLDRRLVLEIKRRLVNKQRSISEIAYILGFKELSHFTKFFKSKTGITPSTFRQDSTS